MTACCEIKKAKLFCIVFISILFLAVSAQAKLYIMGKVNGSTIGPATDSLTMQVEEMGSQIQFTFTNNIDSKGVLTRVFFMDNDQMTFNSIDDTRTSEGVYFSLNDKNAMMPGGKALGFTPHNTFSLDADPAGPKNGLHFQDSVSALFDVSAGVSFNDIIASIDNRSLGVGVQTQAMQGGMSSSFTPIPEPVTLALLGFGALLVQHKKRGTAQKFRAIRSAWL